MAKQARVTYAELVGILHQFQYTPDPEQSAEDHTTFRHPSRRLRIILPALKDRSVVRPVHLVGVRLILNVSAPEDARDFESWLEGRGIRGPSKVPAR